jgi:hypothetical protein
MKELAERYAEELRRVAKGASKEFEKAAAELERIGAMMAADVKSGMRDGSMTMDKAKQRTLDEVNRSLPQMAADLKEIEKDLSSRADRLQGDIRRLFK